MPARRFLRLSSDARAVPPPPARPHDFRQFIGRWRDVARAAGLRLQRLSETGAAEIFFVKTPALGHTGGLYLSAGIHGDEPAGTAGLLGWAEQNIRRLARLPLLIFPCLNPFGLTHNLRTDAAGLDLNRLFHDDTKPVLRAVRNAAAGHQFAAALMLHEDYDGEGVYLYKIQRRADPSAAALLGAAARHLPVDQRSKIDGYTARQGIIHRRFESHRYTRMGYPEAIWLYRSHTNHAFTVETPSEFAFERRVAAHVAVLEEASLRLPSSPIAPGII